MIKASELPDTIAIFPLPGALLLPRARLPLHLFEPRYLQMFEDTLKTRTRLIGMIQPYEVPGRPGTSEGWIMPMSRARGLSGSWNLCR